MTDRIQVLVAVPRDDALPVDVQGVGLRRMAIDLMSEVATVNENTVRYKGAGDDVIVSFGGDIGNVSTWQDGLLAARFVADGKAQKEVIGPVTHADRVTRVYSSASVVRDEFAS